MSIFLGASATIFAVKSAPAPLSSESCLYRVRAVMDSQAQLDDELSFTTGDVIDVIEEQDSDWLIGMSI